MSTVSFFSWADSSVGTQSCPTLPGRSAGRPDPTRAWYVRVLDSTGLRFSDNSFCRKLIRARILRRVLLWCWAFLCWQLRPRFFVNLFVSALTPLSNENTGWPTMPFSGSFKQYLLDFENRLYRREATRLGRRYRRISDYFEIVCLCFPRIPRVRLAVLMRAFTSTTAVLETRLFAILLLL